ncbi:SUN-domain-containing protein [Delitschia confertaspora ATCC 74209]|uniref:SUN-domain-containing protein n=1 Tax=Delitschia confertaspora ATCC 74209 TaxID=1513339 RepID=A0A9P4MQP1_9PLEO|nr:SUN-domain-containing protein [Delitschia confertaspora ATCC 74209]
MKVTLLAIALAANTALAHQGHARFHHHNVVVQKRESTPTADVGTVYAPGPTVIVYVLDGHPISQDEVLMGLANGTLILEGNGRASSVISTTIPLVTPTAENYVGETEVKKCHYQWCGYRICNPAKGPPGCRELDDEGSAVSSVVQVSSIIEPSATPSSETPQPSQDVSGDGLNRVFPTGLPCDKFPTGYGAVPIHHLGLGGWTGIQNPIYRAADGYDDIYTVPTHTCPDGNCCESDAFCSYACPAGYLRTSWPKKQGKVHFYPDGTRGAPSVGGLYCNNGRLEMADGSMAKTLCVKGTDKVTIKVQNNLTESVSICQTDYPGTEGETIPSTVGAGKSLELACPDQATYYHHMGKKTSLQYYINNKGVAEKDACWWNVPDSAKGNYAPMNLGVSYDSDVSRAFISLFENEPTTDVKLDFAVELLLDGPSGMKCKYSNGRWCTGDNYEKCNDHNCDVSFTSGTMTVLLTDH